MQVAKKIAYSSLLQRNYLCLFKLVRQLAIHLWPNMENLNSSIKSICDRALLSKEERPKIDSILLNVTKDGVFP